jgi:cell division protein FtsN
MKKAILSAGILVSLALVSCRTTHPAGIYEKTATPASAQTVISSPQTSVQTPAPASTSASVAKPVAETENVRKESFRLTDSETNKDPLFKTYNVVVGSFANQDNAKNLSATLKSEGKNPAVVVNEKGMFRVIVASFNDYAEATNAKIGYQTRFPDAWLLVQADKK